MKRLLLNWYDENKRDIPFRDVDNPYYTWVSEIMLQQTQVKTVIPYFERFIQTLPTIKSLAECGEDKLLSLWDGLGYYSRVRNMQEAAITVMNDYEGKLPSTMKDLLKLKGIGEYTAGAILSISFDQRVPAIDGNVLRIFSRLYELPYSVKEKPLKDKVKHYLNDLLPNKRVGDFNQALMDLGATVCFGNKPPNCESCPLQSICLSHLHQTTEDYPKKVLKKPRKIEYVNPVLFIYDNEVMIEKRPNAGLLKGMNQFPLLSSEELSQYEYTVLKPTKHLFSHIEWRIETHIVELDERIVDKRFVPISEIESYSIPRAFKQAVHYLKEKSD